MWLADGKVGLNVCGGSVTGCLADHTCTSSYQSGAAGQRLQLHGRDKEVSEIRNASHTSWARALTFMSISLNVGTEGLSLLLMMMMTMLVLMPP